MTTPTMAVTSERQIPVQPAILLLADFAFVPAVSGNTKRVSTLVEAIRSWGFAVHFLGLGSSWSEDVQQQLAERVDSFELIESIPDLDPYGELNARTFAARAWRKLRRLTYVFLGRWPPALDPDLPERCPEIFCNRVKEKVAELNPVAVIAEYIWLSRSLLGLPENVVRILDLHDLMHQRLKQYQGSGLHSFFQCTLNDELKCLRRADAVLVIQEEDRRILAQFLSEDALLLTPHTHAIRPPDVRLTEKRLIFVGSAHAANVEGLRWFLTDIWPLVSTQMADVTFTVVGACCDAIADTIQDAEHCSRIDLRGVVDDVVAELHQARILINPIRRGSGLKIKVVEALCCGLGVVTTTKGVEGIEGIEQCSAVQIADAPDSFACSIAALLDQTDNSAAALEFAESRFSSNSVFLPLSNKLQDAAQRILPRSGVQSIV